VESGQSGRNGLTREVWYQGIDSVLVSVVDVVKVLALEEE